MRPEDCRRHYENPLVTQEIARYSRGRAVAVHCVTASRGIVVRYEPSRRKPLRIENPEDVLRIFSELEARSPRTFYATIHRYAWSNGEPVKRLSSMPSWDIDLLADRPEAGVRAAEQILSTLEKLGVASSTIVKWSGGGFHIHIHDGAISPEIFTRHDPLDVAYAVTEYVSARCRDLGPDVRLENKVDPARVFTCPLSLHRSLDRVCVCIDPEEVGDFDVGWSDPDGFRHFMDWDRFVAGEADGLALRALNEVGAYPIRRRRRVHRPVDEVVNRLLRRLGEGDLPV
jgi:hypothetical protein